VKNKNLVYILAVVGALLLIISCNSCSSLTTGITKVTDAITNPSAREVYARELKNDTQLLTAWQNAYAAAQRDSLQVTLPYGEKGTFAPHSNVAYGYTVALQEGEVLVAGIASDSLNQRVFIDVFEQQGTDFVLSESNKAGERVVEVVVRNTGTYKVILQPEVTANANFFISLNKRPVYGFPVSGKGNAAIGSFWGMERDGGKRSHEGIDIFAKRGTPVVAVTDGTISYTGDRGLGGKQVWQRAGLLGNSLYYAHLDSIKVQSGASVKTGDTLGFVGNTGNARTTTPHLHFGIYKSGAVNPLPFVYQTKPITENFYTRTYKATQLKVKGKANLRQAPATTAATIGALSANDTISLLGQHNDWLHIQTLAGQQAFLHKSLVKEMK